jgi:hypothetical protein
MAASSSLVAALALLLVLVAAVGYSEAYGEPSSTRPSYQERTFASLINAARVGTQIPSYASHFPSSPSSSPSSFVLVSVHIARHDRPITYLGCAFLVFRVWRSF